MNADDLAEKPALPPGPSILRAAFECFQSSREFVTRLFELLVSCVLSARLPIPLSYLSPGPEPGESSQRSGVSAYFSPPNPALHMTIRTASLCRSVGSSTLPPPIPEIPPLL